MPFHRVPRARLHEDITAIEREHEIIVHAFADPKDSEYVLVFTRWVGQDFETRAGR